MHAARFALPRRRSCGVPRKAGADRRGFRKHSSMTSSRHLMLGTIPRRSQGILQNPAVTATRSSNKLTAKFPYAPEQGSERLLCYPAVFSKLAARCLDPRLGSRFSLTAGRVGSISIVHSDVLLSAFCGSHHVEFDSCTVLSHTPRSKLQKRGYAHASARGLETMAERGL